LTGAGSAHVDNREAYTFCLLRAASNSHFSIRKIAQRVAEEILRVHPQVGKLMKLPDESWEQSKMEYFE